MWFEPEQLEGRGSRFSSAIEFVLPLDDDGLEDDEIVRAEVASIQEDLEHGVLKPFKTSVGRGASGAALGLVLEGVADIGGVYGGLQAILHAWRAIRRRAGDVTMSHGALKALVLNDLLIKRPDLGFEDVLVAAEGEVRGPLDPPELSHTGIDVTTFVLCTRSNAESWCYLVTPTGKVLHFNEGGPLPDELLWFNLGILPNGEAKPSDAPMLGDCEAT